MIREVDLVSYLPPFMAEYKETNITLTAENPEFILVWEAAEKVLKNEFIETADEYGISKFEKLLSIIPSKEDTIPIRRARVQAGWFIRLPYTWRMLLQKLTEICGTVTIILKNSYLIHLKVKVELQWQIDSLVDVVSRMLPCNMRISVRNVLSLDLENPAPMIKPGWINYELEYRAKYYIVKIAYCLRDYLSLYNYLFGIMIYIMQKENIMVCYGIMPKEIIDCALG